MGVERKWRHRPHSALRTQTPMDHEFFEAANIYAGHPETLPLRAMNIIYATTKERGATILPPLPSKEIDGRCVGGTTNALRTSLTQGRLLPGLASNGKLSPRKKRAWLHRAIGLPWESR